MQEAHTYTHIHPCREADKHAGIHTCRHTYTDIHTGIPPYIHAYTLAGMHTYILAHKRIHTETAMLAIVNIYTHTQ